MFWELNWYSQQSLFGLPGDLWAHMFFGLLLFIVILKSGFRRGQALLLFIAFCLGKEVLDFCLKADYSLVEFVLDSGFSFAIPFAFLWFDQMKYRSRYRRRLAYRRG